MTAQYGNLQTSHFVFDYHYNPTSQSIVIVFLHPICDDNPSSDAWKAIRKQRKNPSIGFLACQSDTGLIINQKIILDPHGHTGLLLCRIQPTQAAGASIQKFQLVDELADASSPLILEIRITSDPREPKKKHRMVACTSPLTNQGRFLSEWIEYHSLIGVSMFYIYGWDADARIRQVVEMYANAGVARLVDWTLPLDAGNVHFQPHAQVHCLHTFGKDAEYGKRTSYFTPSVSVAHRVFVPIFTVG